jgi:hypothetical protein
MDDHHLLTYLLGDCIQKIPTKTLLSGVGNPDPLISQLDMITEIICI